LSRLRPYPDTRSFLPTIAEQLRRSCVETRKKGSRRLALGEAKPPSGS